MVNLWSETPFINSVAWAITTEIAFYILIGLGIAKTATRAMLWLAASGAATLCAFVYLSVTGGNFETGLYTSVWAGSLPFALGAMVYHVRDRYPLRPQWLLLGGGVLIASTAFAGFGVKQLGRNDLMMLGVYAALIGHAIVILSLYRIRTLGRIDSIIGRFSYPIYLLHLSAFGILINEGLKLSRGDFYTFTAVLLFSVALSAAFLIAIDAPVQWLRARVRTRASSVDQLIHSTASMRWGNPVPKLKLPTPSPLK